ncbi:hypothetical protein OF83DRAFT_1180155 [Amylostereum chailletii]|nr:hypothetical protein OF83DRAFT_1180155 [Amylostereum chailletii]
MQSSSSPASSLFVPLPSSTAPPSIHQSASPDPYTSARILDAHLRSHQGHVDDVIYDPVLSNRLINHPYMVPSIPSYQDHNDMATTRAKILAKLVKDDASHQQWLEANEALNAEWGPNPSTGPIEINGLWIVEGKAQQLGPAMLIEAVTGCGFHYYATAGECLGSDGQSAIYVGRVRNHTSAELIVFIVCNINWTLNLEPNTPASSSIAADWFWTFNLRRDGLIGPPSQVAVAIARLVDHHLPQMLYYATGCEGYSVFVFPPWGNATGIYKIDPWTPIDEVARYFKHIRHAIYPNSYETVETALSQLIAEAKYDAMVQLSNEVQERVAEPQIRKGYVA